MTASIDAALARASDLVRAALPNRPDAPTLPELRLDHAADGVTVTGTDGETFVSVRVPGSAHHSDALVPVRVPVPPLMGEPRKTVDRARLVEALASVMPAAGTDPSRASINGVRLTAAGLSLTLAATDCARYGIATIPAAPAAPPWERTLHLLVAPETLAAAVPHFAALTVGLGWREDGNGSWHSLHCGDITIITKRDQNAFPPHQPLLRLSARARVVVGRDALLAAAGTAPDPSSLTIACGSLSLGGRPLSAATWGVTARHNLVVRPRFLADAVAHLSPEEVVLHLVDPADPTQPIVVMAAGDELSDHFTARHVLIGHHPSGKHTDAPVETRDALTFRNLRPSN